MFGLVAFTGPGTTITERDTTIEFGLDTIPSPGTTIGERRTAIEFCVTALAGPNPTVNERNTTIEFGLVTFACRVPAVLRCLPAVGGGLASGLSETKNDVGRNVRIGSGLG